MAIEITSEMIKELRMKTDVSLIDCKKALIEADGDQAKAEKILKEKGIASAGKRADRAMSEGKIFSVVEGDKRVIFELTCETDFVSKNDRFIALGNAIAKDLLANGKISPACEDQIKAEIAVLKENMSVKRFEIINITSDKAVAFYSHNDGQIGVIVEATVGNGKAGDTTINGFLRDVAMHIAAMRPIYLNRSQVDEAYITEQKEIIAKLSQKDEKLKGKPEQMVKGILEGKLNKQIAEVCLLDQTFVKDGSMTVGKKAEAVAKASGTTMTLTHFIAYRVGA